ncbi:MAG TPA: PDZ domain-containing protein [Candidatus Acidoferrales bacterium]|nr:PDZ domain-containing protein [Candidatus Acidoferrales bacterium]
MKNFACSNLAFAGVLLLALGSTPGTLNGQSQTQDKTPAGSVASPTPSGSAEACLDSKNLTEQLRDVTRTSEQRLQAELANLQEKIAKEVEMNAPELGKAQSLSAQLAARQDEWQARADELAAKADGLSALAQEKAAEVWAQDPKMFGSVSDQGSGWLGVEIGEVTADKAKDLKLSDVRGVEVIDVEPDSPAAKAGLKEHDVITRYDGQSVEGTVQFRRLVRETPVGRNISLAISRNGATQNVSVELGNRSALMEKKMKGKMRDFDGVYALAAPNFDFRFDGPEIFSAMDGRTPSLGISAEDLSGQLGAYFGAPEGGGILVREVRAGTSADKAGLKAGDVIIKIDSKAVTSLGELRQQLRDKSDEKSVSLGILRKGSEMNVAIAIEKPQPMELNHVMRRAQL